MSPVSLCQQFAALAGAVGIASEESESVDASARGTASDLVLAFYGRIPLDSVKLEGDRQVFDLLEEWDME